MKPFVNASQLHGVWIAQVLGFDENVDPVLPLVTSGTGETRELAVAEATEAMKQELERREREVAVVALAGEDHPDYRVLKHRRRRS